MIFQFLRNRIVLALIFCSSLVYFIVQTQLYKAFQRVPFAVSLKPKEDNDLVDRAHLVLAEQLKSRLIHRHIQWVKGESSISVSPSSTAFSTDQSSTAADSIHPKKCRNTKQGRVLITDEHGYVCKRSEMQTSTGCCMAQSPDTPMTRYSCDACQGAVGCCSDFEHCVSCCLTPNNTSNLLDVLSRISSRRLKTFANAVDAFELCMIKCRTSSNSVNRESKYKDAIYKYCYRTEPEA